MYIFDLKLLNSCGRCMACMERRELIVRRIPVTYSTGTTSRNLDRAVAHNLALVLCENDEHGSSDPYSAVDSDARGLGSSRGDHWTIPF